MKKDEIRVGGLYEARVNGRYTTVRVDAIRSVFGTNAGQRYDVTNLSTGRTTTFRSAAKFRREVSNLPKLNPAPRKELTLEELGMGMPRQEELITPVKAAAMLARPGEGIEEAMERVEKEASEEADPTHLRSGETHPVGSLTISPSASAEQYGATATTTEEGEQNPLDAFDNLPPVQAGPNYSKEGEQSSDPTLASIIPASTVDTLPSVERQVVGAVVVTQEVPVQSVESSTVTAPVPTTGLISGLAARIAAQASAPTTSKLTVQQEDILATAKQIEQAYASGQRVMVIAAGAGTGKTFTLKQLEQVLCGTGQYTAFNASLCAESKSKFTRCAVNTTHSLAFRAVGRRFQHRLNSNRMRSQELAYRLGIEDFYVHMPETIQPRDESGNPAIRRIKASYLAGQVMEAVKKFCMSADRTIGPKHFQAFAGLDEKDKYTNSNKVRDYLIPFAERAWADLSSETGTLPYQHDYYVKSWQLGTGADRPIIAADYILLDEAQDTAPVFLDILMQQTHALIVLVGDDNQEIYKWRGACNAMKAFPRAPRRLLSQSFRFGQTVADVANAILAGLEVPTDLIMRGLESIPTRVCPVEKPRCYLYRTNAGAIGRLMTELDSGRRGHLIGGSKEVIAFCEAAIDLQQGRGTSHSDLGCFATWDEVVAYTKEDEGQDLRLLVKLIKEFTAEKIVKALKGMPSEDQADFVVSTAHRSKGREWPSVRLGEDFPTANKLTDEERRLLYVAGTRGQYELDISRCPTFCGGYANEAESEDEDGLSGGRRFIPGIEVRYTVPMPTPEAIAAYRIGRKPPNAVPAANPPVQPVAVPVAVPGPVNGGRSGGENSRSADLPAPSKSAVVELVNGTEGRVVTYAKLPSGEWGLWASAEIKEGELVEVRTRSGTVKRERVGKIVEVNAQAKKWMATKG